MVETIWRQFHQQLLAFIYTKVNDHQIAEDILQEVFIKVHQKLDNLTEESKLQAWLYQICRNTIIDYYRSRQQITLSEQLDENIPAEPAQEDQGQLSRCLKILIADLPEQYNEILLSSELQEEKQQVIADQNQLSLSAVKSRILRGREQLKKKLQSCCDFEFNEFGAQAQCKNHCGCEK